MHYASWKFSKNSNYIFPIPRKIAYRFGLSLFIITIAYLALYQTCGIPFIYLQSLLAPRVEFMGTVAI
jgi:hypothetical protein